MTTGPWDKAERRPTGDIPRVLEYLRTLAPPCPHFSLPPQDPGSCRNVASFRGERCKRGQVGGIAAGLRSSWGVCNERSCLLPPLGTLQFLCDQLPHVTSWGNGVVASSPDCPGVWPLGGTQHTFSKRVNAFAPHWEGPAWFPV